MTIDKAIKRLGGIQMEFLPLPRHEDWMAAQLGIEALKFYSELRRTQGIRIAFTLPGETRE